MITKTLLAVIVGNNFSDFVTLYSLDTPEFCWKIKLQTYIFLDNLLVSIRSLTADVSRVYKTVKEVNIVTSSGEE